MQSRQRGISNVDIYNMDIVTILILDERIWKVVLRTKLVGPIQLFYPCIIWFVFVFAF